MNTRARIVDGKYFDGGVADAGDPKPGLQPGKAAKIPDPILEALSGLLMTADDEEVQKNLSAIIEARMNSNKVARDILDAAMARGRAHLAVEYEDVKSRGRQQEIVLEKIATQIAEAKQSQYRAKDKLAQAQTDLNAAKQAFQSRGKFASNAKTATAQSAVDAASARVDKAQAISVAAWQEIDQLGRREYEEKKKLNNINTELVRVEARINGGEYTDPEFGLVLPGRLAGSFDPPAA
jgi:predicted  nucleic acid-binding Zn-ribbon protein